MVDQKTDPESIIRRCVLDFVRRGEVTEGSAAELAKRAMESLTLLGYRVEALPKT